MKKIATTWSRPAPQGQAPRPRCSHASCMVDGKLVICGGWSSGHRFLDDVHIYSLEANTWSQPALTGVPRVRVGHSMTPGEKTNEIWVMGGTMGASSVLDVQILDLEKKSWSSPCLQGSPPEARSRHTANRFGQYIYLFGGGDNQRLFRDVWQLDTRTLTWTIMVTQGTAPSPRWGHTATLIDTRLFIFGGHDGANRLNDVHILDIETFIWTTPDCRAKPPPSPRSAASLSPSTTEDLAGASPRSSGDDWATIDTLTPPTPPTASSSSSESSPMPSSNHPVVPSISSLPAHNQDGVPPPRAGHSANCLGRKLIIYGGGDGHMLGDMYYLHVDTYEWSVMQSGNVPDRIAHTSEVVYTPGGSRMLVFGGSNGVKTFNDLYLVACSKNRVRIPSGKRKSNSLLRNSNSELPTHTSSNASSPRTSGEYKMPALPLPSSNSKPTPSAAPSSPRNAAAPPSHSPKSPRNNTSSMSYKDALQSPKPAPLKRGPSGHATSSSPRSTTSTPSSSANSSGDHEQLRATLKEAGLEKFTAKFIEQEISYSQLTSLTEVHYKALGLTSIRDIALMKKLKETISKSNTPLPPQRAAQPAPIANGYKQAVTVAKPNDNSTAELARKVQQSTDALATAADSLRSAANKAIKPEDK